MAGKSRSLADLLVKVGLISPAQMTRALSIQKSTGERLWKILIKQNLLTEKQIITVMEQHLGLPFIDLNKISIDPDMSHYIPPTIAKRHNLVPVRKKANTLYIAIEDPFDFIAIEDVRMVSGMEVSPMLALGEDIRMIINQLYGNEQAEKAIADFRKESNLTDVIDIDENIGDEINSAPIVRLVNSLIGRAVQERASDIHIEPFADEVRIRIRIDGRLHTILTTPKSAHAAIIARLKILGGMNIAEKRVPQDGRYETTIDSKDIDIRMSVLPMVHGEKAVLRILDRSSFLIPKDALGFTSENLEKFNQLLKNPHGIILVTGPTGSGKSTTLYTMLNEINNEYDNIITIEDPVEYLLAGLNQVQVNAKTGMTFTAGLRAILRQDPDVIMIGEIRDEETVEIAIRAAITGHLVLSTIHTNDAVSTISRLMDMGIEPYLLAASLVGIISQRLVRRICPSCKHPYVPSSFELKMMGLSADHPGPFYAGTGCVTCNNTGYKGRFPVHEILVVNRKLREMINDCAPIDSIRDYAVQGGMSTLQEECAKALLGGLTTFEEAARVTYSQDT